ncbi:unnamed protein product, partial [Mesocestoides corti]|uniref:Integrase catalytic domain-containing protein n=1 Tax=Mesocestoides corti TaxID=53468 RepID=A0A0R3UD36_MESCO
MTAGFPNELVGLDLMGPLPQTANGYRYILVMVDYFTKWANAIPLRKADAASQLRRSFETARSQLVLAHKRQKDYYDKAAYGAPVEEGDRVWVAIPSTAGEGRKLQQAWEGPYVVDSVLSEATCVVRGPADSPGRGFTVHFNKLKPYRPEEEDEDEPLVYCEPPPVDNTVEIAAVEVDEKLGTASLLRGGQCS